MVVRWTKKLRLRLRSLFRRGRVEEELSEELQYHLQHLIDDANLFAQHQRAAVPTLADARRYTIGVIEGKRRCRVTVAEPVEDDAMRALISKLRGFARSARRR